MSKLLYYAGRGFTLVGESMDDETNLKSVTVVALMVEYWCCSGGCGEDLCSYVVQ